MRLLVAALAALLLLNVTMASMRRSFTRELAVLESRHSERAKAAERTAKEMAREGVRRELIARARAKGLPRHLGLGAVRDLLIGAEHGLGINRLSLEFRPLQASGFPSNGSQVSATLGGSFEGLFDYLDRIESLRLPLAPQELSFQRDVIGALELTIRWTALWSEVGEPAIDIITSMKAWLARESPPRPERDPFSAVVRKSVPGAPGTVEPPRLEAIEPAGPRAPAVASEVVPVLIGFVVARPELESDVRRRVLAALRYEGEIYLVAVGDRVGEYRVELVEARERVELLETDSRERVVLELP